MIHSLAHKIGGEFGITYGLTNPRESNPKIVEMIYTSVFYGKDIVK